MTDSRVQSVGTSTREALDSLDDWNLPSSLEDLNLGSDVGCA